MMGIQEPSELMAPIAPTKAAGQCNRSLTSYSSLFPPGREEHGARVHSAQKELRGWVLVSTFLSQATESQRLSCFSGCVQSNNTERRFNRRIAIRHQGELLFARRILKLK